MLGAVESGAGSGAEAAVEVAPLAGTVGAGAALLAAGATTSPPLQGLDDTVADVDATMTSVAGLGEEPRLEFDVLVDVLVRARRGQDVATQGQCVGGKLRWGRVDRLVVAVTKVHALVRGGVFCGHGVGESEGIIRACAGFRAAGKLVSRAKTAKLILNYWRIFGDA